jgi:hypothetical protein
MEWVGGREGGWVGRDACACVEHDDGIVSPSSGDDGSTTVVQAKIVEKAGDGLGDGAQHGAGGDVPHEDFGRKQ